MARATKITRSPQLGPSGYNNIVTASYRNPEAGGSASYRSIQASATTEGFSVAAVGPSGYNNIVTASYAEPEAGNSFSRRMTAYFERSRKAGISPAFFMFVRAKLRTDMILDCC